MGRTMRRRCGGRRRRRCCCCRPVVGAAVEPPLLSQADGEARALSRFVTDGGWMRWLGGRWWTSERSDLEAPLTPRSRSFSNLAEAEDDASGSARDTWNALTADHPGAGYRLEAAQREAAGVELQVCHGTIHLSTPAICRLFGPRPRALVIPSDECGGWPDAAFRKLSDSVLTRVLARSCCAGAVSRAGCRGGGSAGRR